MTIRPKDLPNLEDADLSGVRGFEKPLPGEFSKTGGNRAGLTGAAN